MSTASLGTTDLGVLLLDIKIEYGTKPIISKVISVESWYF